MNTVLQENIKQQLKKKNMSIAELERRIGSRHAVVNIIHGRSKNPSIHVAHAIAKALGCSVESMLEADLGDGLNLIESQVLQNDSNLGSKLSSSDSMKSSLGYEEHSACEWPLAATESHVKKDVIWDPIIGEAALTAVSSFVSTHKLSPKVSKVLYCVEEICDYAASSKEKQIDYKFLQWVCKHNLI